MVGIDKPINQLTASFTKYLWTSNDCDYKGRIYDNELDGGLSPDEYNKEDKYIESLLNGNKDATIFFRITDIDSDNLMADVEIYASINLEKIYPTLTNRADEKAAIEIQERIFNSPFHIKKTVKGKDAFSAYKQSLQNKYDMHPYCLLRFDTDVSFDMISETTTEPTTVTATVTSGEGGTTDPAPDVYTRSLNENNGYYAIAEAGYKFSQWLKDGIVRLTNPIAVLAESNYTLVAEFVVSSIKQLTIAVSGNGTTSPAPDDYDIESGESQLITAIENDSDYIFDHFNQDGAEYTTNPKSFTIIENSLVVAYFIIKWTQWVFNNAVSKILGLTYFIDRSPNANNVQVKNIQVGNFYSTSIYLQFTDLTGIEIESYNGTFIPEKSGDTIIITTLGLAYDLTLDNGMKATFNEGLKDEIHFTDNAGNVLIATLENVVLSTFWNTKNEFGTSGIHLNGYSKYYVCESAGTSVMLGETDGSNLSAEKVINGDFNDGTTGWIARGDATIANVNNTLVTTFTTSSAGRSSTNDFVTNTGSLYKVEFKVSLPLTTSIKIFIVSRNPVIYLKSVSLNYSKKYTFYFIAPSESIWLDFGSDTSVIGETFTLDNVSVKEVTAISLLSTFKFKLKPTICDTYWLDSSDITTGSGYMYRQTPIASTLFRVDAGVLTQLSTAAPTYTNYKDIEPTFSETGISVKVNDIEILTSTDTTYSTFKVIVVNNSVGDEFSHFTKGGVKYDVDCFINGTGTYGVQKVLGKTTLLDAKGNTLEIPTNVVSNSGNTYDGIEGLSNDATYEEIYELETDSNQEITKTENKEMGYVSQLKILT